MKKNAKPQPVEVDQAEESNVVGVAATTSAVAEYLPFYSQLAELEKKNTSLVFDYASKKGDKEARSHIYSLRLTKGALDRVRKEAKADYLAKGRAVDSEAAAIEGRIEAMILVHQAELDKIEQAEKDRVTELEARLFNVRNFGAGAMSVADIEMAIANLGQIVVDESWQEFQSDAESAKAYRFSQLKAALDERRQKDADEAELIRLRAEKEARDKADREAEIARKAVAEAEERARQEAANQQQEAARKEAEATQALKNAQEAGERAKLAAQARELELKAIAQQAEQDRLQAVKDAEAKAAQAVKAEQDRVAVAKRAEEAEAAKREANNAHRGRVNKAALEALVHGGIAADVAKAVVILIAQGKIPAVAISY